MLVFIIGAILMVNAIQQFREGDCQANDKNPIIIRHSRDTYLAAKLFLIGVVLMLAISISTMYSMISS